MAPPAEAIREKFMSLRVAVLGLGLSLLAACEVSPVDGGDAAAVARANAALGRTCIGSVAASLKVERKGLAAIGFRSLPEGDEVTVRLSETEVARCDTDLDGKVAAIQRVQVTPAAVPPA
jgi:hypothetical protein